MRRIAACAAVVLVLAVFITTALAFEIKGVIQSVPPEGYFGEYVINGRTVYVTEGTKIKEKYGRLTVGAFVEVDGKVIQGRFMASKIETKVPK